jgi:hypothetical protein
MPDRPTDAGSVPDDRYENAEAALGGADAVPKTTYVTGLGTEPEARPASGEKPFGHSPAAAGPNTAWIVIAFLVVAAVLVYLLGYGR